MPVLLLGGEPVASDPLAEALRAHGLRVVTPPDLPSALAQAADAQLVIVDSAGGSVDAGEACRRLRAQPDLSDLPLLCLAESDDVEERVRLLEAGADDVMSRPFDTAELEARVDALLARSRRARSSSGAPVPTSGADAGPDRPRLLAFFGPKGGSGTTALAVNTAVALAMRRDLRVALADLDLQFGDVATLLNLASKQPLTDLIQDPTALHEPGGVVHFASDHPTGLAVFPAPARPDLAVSIPANTAAQLLDALRDTYQVVVADAGSNLDDLSLTVFEYADKIVIPVVPEIPGLRAVRTLLEMLVETERDPSTLVVVLSHVFSRDMLRRDDIERAIGRKVDVEIAHDPSLFLSAANAGEPIASGAPRSGAAQRFVELASLLVGEAAAVPGSPESTDSSRPRLTSILRRG